MGLRLIGADPTTGNGNCPTVLFDEDRGEIVVQRWNVDAETRAKCLDAGPIFDHEEVVRLPARMADILRRACDDASRAVV